MADLEVDNVFPFSSIDHFVSAVAEVSKSQF
jgi:hypothetical protein